MRCSPDELDDDFYDEDEDEDLEPESGRDDEDEEDAEPGERWEVAGRAWT